jgi:predicted  nucleic acid-binding Zn-ribbon protein
MATVRRLREEHDFALELSRAKTTERTRELKTTKAKLDAALSREAQREEEFRKYRAATDKTKNGQLRALVAARDTEVRDLTHRLSTACAAETQLKSQLQQCLGELGRMRKQSRWCESTAHVMSLLQ